MRTTCTCGAEWTAMRAEHCCSCHQTFASTKSGDMHRRGEHALSKGPNRRRCLTIEEMLAKGMSTNKAGHWISVSQYTGPTSHAQTPILTPTVDQGGALGASGVPVTPSPLSARKESLGGARAVKPW